MPDSIDLDVNERRLLSHYTLLPLLLLFILLLMIEVVEHDYEQEDEYEREGS
jgi:hypothetical protein